MPNLIEVTITFKKSGPLAPRRRLVVFAADRDGDLAISPGEAIELTEEKGVWSGGFERVRPLNGMIAVVSWEFSVEGELTLVLHDRTTGWSFKPKTMQVKADKTGSLLIAVPS